MGFDQVIAIVGTSTGLVGVVLATASFVYGINKDRQENHRFRQETIDALNANLIEIMSRGMGGIHIPGMSEIAGEQLKTQVYDVLQRHLQSSSNDRKTRKVVQKLRAQSRH